MRSHTTLRTAFLMIAAATGVSLAAGEARADVAPVAGAANTSVGTAALKYAHNKALEVGDLKMSAPPVSILGVKATVGAELSIDPVKNGGPLFTVDMPKGAVVQASWANDKKITLKAVNGAQTDGTVTVRHTLSPTFDLSLGYGSSAPITFRYNATDLLQMLQSKLPFGADAKFSYDSRASKAFAPWGFAKVDTILNAPDLDGSELFAFQMADIPLLHDNNFDGDFGVRATTNPTFAYTTKKVALSGASGTISAQGGEVTQVAIDGDFMETIANVEGEMNVAGAIKLQPFVHVTKVPNGSGGTWDLVVDIPVTVYEHAYTAAATKCAFQAVVVHIPLPNVHAPKQGVNLGAVKPGGSATKSVTIENSGEKAASMIFKSSDPSFTVPGGTINIEPKGTYDLQVKFASANAGAASSEITVLSNDPDSPEQMFKIGANGADVGAPAEDAVLPKSAAGESGCGCKTAGSSGLPSWAGFGLLGLGAVVFVRRRKNAR